MEAAPAGSAKAPLASPQATATAHRGLIFMASSCTRGQAVDRRAAAFSRRPNTAVAGAALDDKHGANARGGAGYENIMPAPTTGGAAGSGAMGPQRRAHELDDLAVRSGPASIGAWARRRRRMKAVMRPARPASSTGSWCKRPMPMARIDPGRERTRPWSEQWAGGNRQRRLLQN